MAMNDKDLLDYVKGCYDEADMAKNTRMELNKQNFNMFHLRHDFSHKLEGQSTEVMAKQRMAVEQITSFFQQALADIGDWFRVEKRNNTEELSLLRPSEIQKLTDYQLRKADYYSHVGNAVQSGLLGALIITKTTGKLMPKPRFTLKKKKKGKKAVEVVDDKTWELQKVIVPQENFYPDPIPGRNLYDIEEMYLDLSDLMKLSQGDDAIYDQKEVNQLSKAVIDDFEEQARLKRETGQDTDHSSTVPRVKLWEFWGDVVDGDGKVVHENVVITIANETTVVRGPEPNPLWHQKRPFVKSPLIEVANSVWPIALMDAPTKHNSAMIEIYNLILDSAMKAVWGITQIRIDDLDDPSQVSGDTVPWGTNLKVRSTLPPGEKVMEPVVSGDVPQDALNVLNLVQQEFNSSALTNDLRQGVVPFRQVKATEVVEASQTITSVFQGVAKNVEVKLIQKELEQAWQTVAQNLDKISKEELQSLFGQERGEQISQMSPEEVFVETVNGCKFEVFGVSMTLSKAQDFRKLTTLLQTVGSSEVLLEEFIKKYDFGKLLGEIMTSLDIRKEKIELPEERQAQEGGPELGEQVPQGDQASQVPQAGAGSLADILAGDTAGGIPQASFPGSRATQGI